MLCQSTPVVIHIMFYISTFITTKLFFSQLHLFNRRALGKGSRTNSCAHWCRGPAPSKYYFLTFSEIELK